MGLLETIEASSAECYTPGGKPIWNLKRGLERGQSSTKGPLFRFHVGSPECRLCYWDARAPLGGLTGNI